MSSPSPLAFACDASDHCETSDAAYADIAPLLDYIGSRYLSKDRETLRLYDPYYCQGSAVARLNSLGFPQVYNRNEDFYKVLKAKKVPDHDVLLTNPPFSQDHIQRALHFAGKNSARPASRPWCLLLPNHVYCQSWYEALMQSRGEQPLYLCPKTGRYDFHSQYSLGRGVGSTKSSSSSSSGGGGGGSGAAGLVCPFPTLWHIGGLGGLGDVPTVREELVAWFESTAGRAAHGERCTLAASTADLPKRIKKLERYAKKDKKKGGAGSRRRKAAEKAEKSAEKKRKRQQKRKEEEEEEEEEGNDDEEQHQGSGGDGKRG